MKFPKIVQTFFEIFLAASYPCFVFTKIRYNIFTAKYFLIITQTFFYYNMFDVPAWIQPIKKE